MAEKVNVDKALDINKDGFSNGGIDIETPGQTWREILELKL